MLQCQRVNRLHVCLALADGDQIHVPGVSSLKIHFDQCAIRVSGPNPARICEAYANVEQYKRSLYKRPAGPWLESIRQLEFIRNDLAHSETRQATEQKSRVAMLASHHLDAFRTLVRLHIHELFQLDRRQVVVLQGQSRLLLFAW